MILLLGASESLFNLENGPEIRHPVPSLGATSRTVERGHSCTMMIIRAVGYDIDRKDD